MFDKRNFRILAPGVAALLLTACIGEEPAGLAESQSAATTVVMDFFHRPLPKIPLPNDVATRYDSTSATGRRINASMIAPTGFEANVRMHIDKLDGWGIFMPITIPFSGPLDAKTIVEAHHKDPNYDLSNDVVYLINVDVKSPEFGKIHHLDLGRGNYPVVLENRTKYWKNDPRVGTLSLLFEDTDEDLNKNGKMDPGEDTDADGVLDRPNYYPASLLKGGAWPADTDLAGRADALMSFFELETNTLIMRPMVPLSERTTYAVVVTRRLKDASGKPVGSPYRYVNHASQNNALTSLAQVMPRGLEMKDVAFAFAFTTQSIESPMQAVRDGLYGHGIQAHLGQNFPAEVKSLSKLKDMTYGPFAKATNPYILHTEQFTKAYEQISSQLLNQKADSVYYKVTHEAQRYVDYHVVGSFDSPQLFERKDAAGKLLGLNDQSWPPDLDRVPAKTRSEKVNFWLVVPRKEVSARGAGKPAPVVILGHGYGSNRFEALAFGAYLAKFGLATLSIDCVSHGLGLSKSEQLLAKGLGAIYGISPFVTAALEDRAADLNNDGIKNSGGDFWTAYMFHTRDVVRQSALDYMQLIRIFRTFDGKKRWNIDVLGKGKGGLAGDFDGDGAVDVGGSGSFHMTGGSLGGIMAILVGGLEPALSTVMPIAGAGGLGDVGLRSQQGGVPQAVILRVMGPLYLGTTDSKTGKMKLETTVPNVNDDKTLPIATVEGVKTGDTVVVENLVNKETGCAYVTKAGIFRTSVESDLGDRTRIMFYAGDVLDGEDCKLKSGAKPYKTVDRLEEDFSFQGTSFEIGDDLTAQAEGLGLKRASPEFRRFISLAQLVLDPGDPASFSRHLVKDPLVYPGTGEKTGAHVMIITTVGDMNVPASTGIISARSAGLVPYLNNDSRYGKSANQVLLDTFTSEAVHNLKRYTDSKGGGVHMDVDNYSQGKDRWGKEVPRLNPPLRLGFDRLDPQGGKSAAVFPMSNPTGTHGFDFPGQMIDGHIGDCQKICTVKTGADPCGCKAKTYFDIGHFMINMLGHYAISEGKDLVVRDCYGTDSCTTKKPLPKIRDATTLP